MGWLTGNLDMVFAPTTIFRVKGFAIVDGRPFYSGRPIKLQCSKR
jgi:hypothetical protein